MRTEIAAREKAEENQGLEKYRENQSSEGNQIGIFFYLWFYVEISFSKGQQILWREMKFEETVLTADGVVQLFFNIIIVKDWS